MNDTHTRLVTGACRGLGIDVNRRHPSRTGRRVPGDRHRPRRLRCRPSSRRPPQPHGRRARRHRRGTIGSAVRAGVERLGRIDVLVDNTGNFQPGFFEEISPAQFRAQMETNLFGPLDVTRAVLPIMRRQRPGHVVTITSTAGIVSGAFGSAYGASKFALEGWMESLRGPLRPAGADAVEAIARKGRALSDPATALQELSTALDHVEGV